jgi:hypothetical protein
MPIIILRQQSILAHESNVPRTVEFYLIFGQMLSRFIEPPYTTLRYILLIIRGEEPKYCIVSISMRKALSPRGDA